MKTLIESILDDEEDLIDNTEVKEEDLVKKYVETHYKVYPNDKVWVKKSRKQVEMKSIIPNHDVETLELPFGYTWTLSYLGDVQIWMNDKIKDLKGCPTSATRVLVRSCNNLTSLEGAPKHVEEEFGIDHCDKLKNLKGGPEYVGKKYDVQYNNGLENLEGAPKKMKGTFICSHSSIKSLKGAPKMEKGRFICNDCKNLISLDGLDIDLNKVRLSIKECKNLPVENVMKNLNISEEEANILLKK